MSLADWIPLFIVCLLGAMSPGPSLAVVTANSIRGGRKAGVVAGFAHGMGIAVYALITVSGLALLLTRSPALFVICQALGALYLLYLGIQSLRTRIQEHASADGQTQLVKAARDGFLVAFLNPKIAVFMLALFAQFLGPDADLNHKITMVLTVTATDAVWYMLIATLLTRPGVIDTLTNHSQYVDLALGAILIVLALLLLGDLIFNLGT